MTSDRASTAPTPGRQALTGCITHIIVGMGAIKSLGLSGRQPVGSVIMTSVIFILLSIIYLGIRNWFANLRSAEWLMRRVAG